MAAAVNVMQNMWEEGGEGGKKLREEGVEREEGGGDGGWGRLLIVNVCVT